MTAVLLSKSNKTPINVSSNTSELSTSQFKLSPTNSEAENEPRSPEQHKSNTTNMHNTTEDLILNTNFDFHAPAFSPHQLHDESKKGQKRVTDHMMENGERIVIVDPNVSEGEDNDEEELESKPETSQQLSPLDKAISSLFAAASNQQTHQRKRSSSPAPKTVSGILAKRRKVEKPQKRASESDFSTLNDSLLASSSFLSALTSVPSTSRQKPTGSRPSSSNSDLGTSKSSLSDSGIVSADEQPTVIPAHKHRSHTTKAFASNDCSIPAPVLQLLINAAGGADMNNVNLSDLLASDPNLLKSINDVISTNPSQQHTLQIVSTESKNKSNANQESSRKTAQQHQNNEQLSSLLASWPELLANTSKLSDQSTPSQLLNNNQDTVDEDNQQELLRLGGEWLIRELFKGKALDKPQPVEVQPSLRKRKLETQSPQLKSSESVLSQLKSLKGQKQLAELEELENFAAHFKRQRIKHGFTQGDVGVALGRRYGTDFSQTTISRFEALNLSFKNMCKLRPLMEEWLIEAESAIQRGYTVSDIVEAETLKNDREQVRSTDSVDSSSPTSSTPQPFGGNLAGKSTELALLSSLSPNGVVAGLSSVLPTLKKRRKRTNLDNQQKDRLDTYFIVNPRPDHQQMNAIADELDLDPDVVRVWFCNKRQKLRKV